MKRFYNFCFTCYLRCRLTWERNLIERDLVKKYGRGNSILTDEDLTLMTEFELEGSSTKRTLKRKTRTRQDWLEDLNDRVKSSYEQPDFSVGGWRFFFLGYLTVTDGTNLIGKAVAWHEYERRFYICLTNGQPQEYKPGDKLDLSNQDSSWLAPWVRTKHIDVFLDAKRKALSDLSAFVAAREATTSVSA